MARFVGYIKNNDICSVIEDDKDIAGGKTVADILGSEFRIYRHLPVEKIPAIDEPVKFTSNASIYMRCGECAADIDLMSFRIQAPSIVNIRAGQILVVKKVSEDFDASVMVMSREIWDAIFNLVKDCKSYPIVRRHPVAQVPPELMPVLDDLYDRVGVFLRERDNPNIKETMIFGLTTFFFRRAHTFYDRYADTYPTIHSRVVDRFVSLVQQNFRRQRFLDFYASKLDITSKHLSRTVKAQTGHTAVEWIERYVILEAKAMLRSSNLTVQQISDELYFPSQSFFGKYFKKSTGMSPKEFRNMLGGGNV